MKVLFPTEELENVIGICTQNYRRIKMTQNNMTYYNVERLEDALSNLYETVIVDDGNAELRGMAITAIDRMIINLRGESAVDKIESVPFTKRLRRSEHPELRKFGEDLGKHFGVEE